MLTEAQAYQKASAYCAGQEKCVFDIRLKFAAWGVDKGLHSKIVDKLIKEDFINEKRYAESFARGKLLNNQWGKNKIKAELRAKNISAENTQTALEKIDNETYRNVLQHILQKKIKYMGELSAIAKNKTAQYAISKGFEPEIVFSLLKLEQI